MDVAAGNFICAIPFVDHWNVAGALANSCLSQNVIEESAGSPPRFARRGWGPRCQCGRQIGVGFFHSNLD